MKELELKYGCNPNQKPASIAVSDGPQRQAGVYQPPGRPELLAAR